MTSLARSLALELRLQDIHVGRVLIKASPRHGADAHSGRSGAGLDAEIGLGCKGSISTRCADAKDTDLVGVHLLAAGEISDGRFDVLDALGGIFKVSGLAFGFTLVCSVVGEADKAGLGEHAGIVCRRLLLDGRPRMAYDDGGARAIGRAGNRLVEVSCEFEVAGEKGDVLRG